MRLLWLCRTCTENLLQAEVSIYSLSCLWFSCSLSLGLRYFFARCSWSKWSIFHPWKCVALDFCINLYLIWKRPLRYGCQEWNFATEEQQKKWRGQPSPTCIKGSLMQVHYVLRPAMVRTTLSFDTPHLKKIFLRRKYLRENERCLLTEPQINHSCHYGYAAA